MKNDFKKGLGLFIGLGLIILIFTAFFIWLGDYASKPIVVQPTQTVYIHDTTIVREEIFKCGPVKHDTIIIHVKD